MDYKSIVNLRLHELLKLLQYFTLENAKKIKSNLDLLNSYDYETKKREMSNIFRKNNELTKISVGYIDLHNKIFSFINQLRDIIISDIDLINFLAENEELKYNRDKYFKLTITDVISYNEEHPFFNDESFRQNLIEYYTKNENYEKCSELKNKK
jgi:hypothetical protein